MKIIFLILLVLDTSDLIQTISTFVKSNEKDMPKKLKRKMCWEIFGVLSLAYLVFFAS